MTHEQKISFYFYQSNFPTLFDATLLVQHTYIFRKVEHFTVNKLPGPGIYNNYWDSTGSDIIEAITILRAWSMPEVISGAQISFITETTVTPAQVAVKITVPNTFTSYQYTFTMFAITADMDECISTMYFSDLFNI